MDNSDSSGVSRVGFWSTSTAAGRYGANSLYTAPGDSKDRYVEYKPQGLAAGNYNVYISYVSGTNRAGNVPVEISHNDESQTVLVDQKVNGFRWFRVCTYYFTGDGNETVRIKNEGTPSSGNGYVIADAVRFSPNSVVPVPPPKPDLKLGSLTVNTGALGPVFDPGTAAYTLNVPNSVSSLNLTAVTASSASEVSLTINGSPATSGTPKTIALTAGPNTVTIVVTALNQPASKTYTVTINRASAASGDATLASLTLGKGSLSPVFHPDTASYTVGAGYSMSSVAITPIANSASHQSITVNGAAVISGSAKVVSLSPGVNTVTIVVKAENNATKTYTLTITRAAAASNDSALGRLSLSEGDLSFQPGITSYQVKVSSIAATLLVTPEARSPFYSSMKVNGTAVAAGAGREIALAVGANTVTIEATAENGTSKTIYTLQVERAASAGETVGHSGIIRESIAARISQAVMLFAGNSQGYANNVRRAIDMNNEAVKPFFQGSLIYVPLKYTAEGLGAVSTAADPVTMTVTQGSKVIIFTAGSSQVKVNGQNVSIPAPVIARSGQLFVSAETVTQLSGKQAFQHNSGLVVFSDTANLFQLPADQELVQYIVDGFRYQWGNVKIYPGGFVTGMVIHPTEPELKYVRTDVGGAYRWNPVSQEWVPLMESFGLNELNLLGIDGIAVSRTNPDIVYVAAGMYGNKPSEPHDVLKSTDRGQTWQRTNLNKRFYGNSTGSAGDQRLDGERIQVDPYNADTVYVGTRYDGLWRSLNGGASWQQVTAIPLGTAPAGVTNVEFDYSAGAVNGKAKVIYIGVEGSGVYKSTDGGATWSSTMPSLTTGPVYPRRMAVAGDGNLYVTSITGLNRNNLSVATAPTNGVFKYNGSAWTNVTPSAGAGKPFGPIAVMPGAPGTLVAVEGYYEISKVYLSTNGGQSWTYKGDSYGASSQFLFDPHHPEELYDLHGAGIHKTLNITSQAISWIAAGDGIEELCALKMLSLPNGRLIMGTLDRGGFSTTDISVPAVRLSGPTTSENTALDFSEADPNYVFRLASSQLGETPRAAYSTDGGQSWTEVTYPYGFGGSVAVSSKKQANGLPLVVIWTNGHTPKLSRDFGQTWEDTVFYGVPAPVYTGNIYNSRRYGLEADRAAGDTFYLYDTAAGGFYISKDGKNWTRQTTVQLPASGSSDIAGVRAAPGMAGEVWASANKGGLFRSSDSGRNFTKIAAVQEALLFSFGKNAPGSSVPSVYVYGRINNQDGIFRSDDLGATWTRISHDAYQIGNDPKSLAGDRSQYGVVYVGTGGRGIYYGRFLPDNP
ncbi:cadherin-like beta sandwich domain-containing protein [Paenibacillus sp. YN15]|uniref:cadherin-like beta sandwich domain-containing protein n=1 Tax=Paenibacillus sp. YN15 TaxID=1742774 RepID=UPI0015EC0DF0|nr:cadherin-like beta sandwich domain-containing protein [Paenibacillus sp. YN15]